MAGTTGLEPATSAVTDGTASHWKYVVDNVNVYRGVYRAGLLSTTPDRRVTSWWPVRTKPLGRNMPSTYCGESASRRGFDVLFETLSRATPIEGISMFTRKPVPSFRRAGIGCLSLLLTLGCAGAIYQWGQSRLDRRMNPAPGQLIDVGGYRIHIYCVGGGSPTVVLDSGLSDSSLSWDRVQPEIAKFTRVCAYDRAGLGWSDPSPKPRNSKVFAEELHTLLHNAGIPVPYVFVGHSMGGFDALIYARLYGPEVAGMVLVDSPHPDFANRLPELRRGLADWRQHLRWQQLAMPFGIARLMGWCGNGQPELQSKLRADSPFTRRRNSLNGSFRPHGPPHRFCFLATADM